MKPQENKKKTNKLGRDKEMKQIKKTQKTIIKCKSNRKR